MNNLVDFEVAQKLKSLGFNNSVNNFFYEDGVLDNGDGDNEFICINHNCYIGYTSCPTIEEMFEWLHSTSDENVDEFIKFLIDRNCERN